MFLEHQEVAFRPALLAVVLPCLFAEVEVSFSFSAVLVAGIEEALGNEFVPSFKVGDALLIEIVSNRLLGHRIMVRE